VCRIWAHGLKCRSLCFQCKAIGGGGGGQSLSLTLSFGDPWFDVLVRGEIQRCDWSKKVYFL
jgi:hypothetical protein